MIRTALFEFLTRLAARHPVWVIVVGVLLTAVSVVSSTIYPGVEVKTNLSAMMGAETEPAIQQAYMETNFPNASTVQVFLEGKDPDRLAEIAIEISKFPV